MAFDSAGAKAAGYSDEEIAAFQAQIEGAKAAGYSDAEIEQHLASPEASTGKAEGEGTGVKWGFGDALTNGIVLGLGPVLRAFDTATSHKPLFEYLPGPDYAKRAEASPALITMGSPFSTNALAPRGAAPGGFESNYGNALEEQRGARASYQTEHPIASTAAEVTGSLPAIAAATPELAPGLALPLRMAGRAGQGVLASEMQQGLTGQNPLEAAVTGGAIGAAGPFAAKGASSAVGLLLPKINPIVKQAATAAEGLGIKLRPGQLAMSKLMNKTDEFFASKGNAGQLKDYTRAVAKTIGEDSDTLTPEVVSKARDRLGQRFEDFATRNPNLPVTQKLGQDLNLLRQEAAGLDDHTEIDNAIDLLEGRALKGHLTGRDVINSTSGNSAIGTMRNKYFKGKLLDTVFDFLSTSAPKEAKFLADTKDAYRNLLVIQPLSEKAALTAGVIDPKLVPAAVRKGFSDYGWAQPGASGYAPQRDLGTLADVGNLLPRPTATGEATGHGKLSLASKVAAIVAEGALYSHNPLDAAYGLGVLGAGAGAGKGIGAVMASDWYRNLALAPAKAPAGISLALPMATGIAGRVLNGK